jgi:tRNA pseudouridine38-40 synthase
MYRYFIELAYKGTAYSGFQIQHNANTIQSEITKALKVISGIDFELTGSSRTDAGVHALQNFFHFDTVSSVEQWRGIKSEQQLVYKLNAILPTT